MQFLQTGDLRQLLRDPHGRPIPLGTLDDLCQQPPNSPYLSDRTPNRLTMSAVGVWRTPRSFTLLVRGFRWCVSVGGFFCAHESGAGP
jgi:hypothetical protein